ncbi:unnamed protein product [Ectocarpus fasciculatus]
MWDAKVLKAREDLTDADKYCHFNNAGASPMPAPVVQAVKQVLDSEHLLGGYEAQELYEKDIQNLYSSIGRLLNAPHPTKEIALVDSATTAWVKAFYSVPLSAGDVILVSKVEYAANMVAILQQSRRVGASIVYIPSDEHGCVCLKALESILNSTPSIKLVCITWIPTNGGVVNDAARIGQLVAQHSEVLYLLDACQAVGHIKVDVQVLGCHMLAATGRKYLRGPRGTGFLYISEKTLSMVHEPATIDHLAAPWVELGAYAVQPSARRYEQWEKNISGLVGLGVAIDYYLDEASVGVEWAEQRVRGLATKLRWTIDRSLPNITLYDLGDSAVASTQCGIVSFSVNGVSASAVKKILRDHSIFVSVSSPASTLIDASARSLPDVVRASVHYFNTELEIFLICDVLRDIINAV